ncbi:hypothetical protein COMA2_10042 [Candidatus Nitrospira nitrificans]|uniref:Uncharacterized protein n=2 Tax=Candidatus Nitrospira nitrificans TaxID=1742973 RepID=A0A0S4L3N2_9BACT|nr:hypothetical protein COMA2_10042 [Candidatus Nitrospira nitrificans]
MCNAEFEHVTMTSDFTIVRCSFVQVSSGYSVITAVFQPDTADSTNDQITLTPAITGGSSTLTLLAGRYAGMWKRRTT